MIIDADDTIRRGAVLPDQIASFVAADLRRSLSIPLCQGRSHSPRLLFVIGH